MNRSIRQEKSALDVDAGSLKATGIMASKDMPLRSQRAALMRGGLMLTILLLAFSRPLISLAAHAASSNLNSYILLIPGICAYLLYLKRDQLLGRTETSIALALAPAALGIAALAWAFHLQRAQFPISENDFLSLTTLAFVAFVIAGGFLTLGRKWMARAAFPIAFLIFIIPLPDSAVDFLETASKLASADVAHLFFTLTGTPVLRDGVVFQLPGFAIRVAQECSGIHSSLVLFITSLLMSHLLLKTYWRQALVVAFVIPLGIIRNGFRILVISLLGVHISPKMIDSPIHHHGGPLFFALSLIPLVVLLRLLRKGEMRRENRTSALATTEMNAGRA